MKKYLLFFSLLSSLVLFYGCGKELSFESSATPSEGSLQSDVSGDCLPKTVVGVYEAGTALNSTTNYIEVTVDVTMAGSYVITTDNENGISFRASGFFTTTGLNMVRLRGTGTPVASGISNFVVTYGTTECTVPVTILPAGGASPAVFTLSVTPPATTCMSAVVSGTYTQGVALTGSANQVVIDVNVTTIGTYNVSTVATNGITFSGTGAFLTPGAGTITLTASGTPGTSGTTSIPVVVGTSACNFPVTVIGPATYTINCGSAVVNGSYAQGIALNGTNTVGIQVNVTTPGGYSITGTISGMTFSFSGAFSTAGLQTITLAGSGTPTASGTLNVPLTGGTTPCSFPVPVTGPATYTIVCGSASVNGDYDEGVALDASNTVDIDVNVATTGPYTITGTVNGMTFAKTGVFSTTGTQSITLAGSGTPAADGTFNVPMAGLTACTFPVTVDPGVSIDWKFTAGATTYQGSTQDAQLISGGGGNFLIVSGTVSSGFGSINITLTNTSGSISTGSYSGTAIMGKFASFSFSDGATTYMGGPTTGSNLPVNLTVFSTATHTVSGTFSGTVKDGGGSNVSITNGTFTANLP